MIYLSNYSETWDGDEWEGQMGEEMSAAACNGDYCRREASWTLWGTATGRSQRQDGGGRLYWTWGVRNRKTG